MTLDFLFFFRSFGPANFRTLYGLMAQSFLLCTREILTEEKSKSWTNTQSIAGSVHFSSSSSSILDFMLSLKNFQADLQNISKLNKMKVVLVIDEAQVFAFTS